MIFSFSTDVVGLSGTAKKVKTVYAETAKLFEEKNMTWGVEMVGWRHSGESMIFKLEQLGLRVNGIHGRIGQVNEWKLIDKVKLEAINRLLLTSTNKLVKLAALVEKDGYILVHESELNYQKSLKILKDFRSDSIWLMIENNPSPDSLINTVFKVDEMVDAGTNAGIMIDLLHLTLEITGMKYPDRADWKGVWQEIIARVEFALERVGVAGFHVPIGTTLDSLPVDWINDNQWREFTKVIKKYQRRIRYLTMENQYKGMEIYSNKKGLETAAIRTKEIVSRLFELGIILN